jgi:hypothetical protein
MGLKPDKLYSESRFAGGVVAGTFGHVFLLSVHRAIGKTKMNFVSRVDFGIQEA